MRYVSRITIINMRKPAQQDINAELQWLGTSLGLFNLRDKDKSCFRIFIELLKTARLNVPLTSDELAFRLNLTRGTVVHHLHKLVEAGIVIAANRGYILRVNNLEELIDEVEQDVLRTCADLKKIARKLDSDIGF